MCPRCSVQHKKNALKKARGLLDAGQALKKAGAYRARRPNLASSGSIMRASLTGSLMPLALSVS